MSRNPESFWVHGPFEAFSEGRFDDGGGNLYVNAKGVIETIHRTDLNGDGDVDLVLPNRHGYVEFIIGAYSSETTRVLRMHIFWGTGNGLDLKNPTNIMANSSCGFLPINISGNGYPDLMVACHRDDWGRQVDSMILWNGPQGLDKQRMTDQ